MTQFFGSSSPSSTLPVEKRNFSGISMSSTKSSHSNSHFPQRLRNFFRLNNLGSGTSLNSDGTSGHRPDQKSSFRQSRFLPNMGRNRSTTVASEGNTLDEAMSPTAFANPYFSHQGPPALRHHNESSVPPSPPDTPDSAAPPNVLAEDDDQATTAGKEELARKLRRVASAPNAQGLFAGTNPDGRPATAELGKEPLVQHSNTSTLSMVENSKGNLLPIPNAAGLPLPASLRNSIAFRRTYSSNSIKVRNVEVGPSSFDKIKLIGKGDVGKVYLVREKKSSRLYAMKGMLHVTGRTLQSRLTIF